MIDKKVADIKRYRHVERIHDKDILKQSNQDWTTKQVEMLIIQEGGTRSRYTLITSLENGGLNNKFLEKYMCEHS